MKSYCKDWRIPTADEFVRLFDPLSRNPALMPGHPFINVDCGRGYWSSTPNEIAVNDFFFADLEQGIIRGGNSRFYFLNLWPVCTSDIGGYVGQIRFWEFEPGFVLDEDTHLIWMKDAGQFPAVGLQKANEIIGWLNEG